MSHFSGNLQKYVSTTGESSWLSHLNVHTKLRADTVTITVSNICSHAYLPIKYSTNPRTLAVKYSLVHREFLALTLNLKVKDLNNTANARPHSTTANTIDEDTERCAIGLSFGPRHTT